MSHDGEDAFAPPLDRVSALLEETLEADTSLAADVRHLLHSGKKLRASLVFAAADGGPLCIDSELLRCAAAIELVHTASLLHDDIVDHAVERRGRTTLHRLRGSRVAALAGVCLAQFGVELIAGLSQPIRSRFARAGREAARGQFAELVRARDMHLRPDERVAVMKMKTASIFALACELGGMVAGRPVSEIRRLRSIGIAFGVLFQIADDLDDIFATATELGREPGSDLREGVVSLPVAYALESMVGEELEAMLTDENATLSVARCRALILESGALARAHALADVYLATARRGCCGLRPTNGTRWMDDLLCCTAGRIARHVKRNQCSSRVVHGTTDGAVTFAI